MPEIHSAACCVTAPARVTGDVAPVSDPVGYVAGALTGLGGLYVTGKGREVLAVGGTTDGAAEANLGGLLGEYGGRWLLLGEPEAAVVRAWQIELNLSRELIPLYKGQASELREAYRLASWRADTAEARVTALEDLLGEGRQIIQCRIAGLLPCPSRGVMFVLGVATTAAVVVVAR